MSVLAALLENGSDKHGAIEDIVALIQLYGAQLTRTLLWHVDNPLSAPLLEEMECVTRFFFAFARASAFVGLFEDRHHSPSRPVLRAYADRVTHLLQHLNYALSHPKHLESLYYSPTLRPPKERGTLSNRILRLVHTVISTLCLGCAIDTVFTQRPADWPIENGCIIQPVSMRTIWNCNADCYDSMPKSFSESQHLLVRCWSSSTALWIRFANWAHKLTNRRQRFTMQCGAQLKSCCYSWCPRLRCGKRSWNWSEISPQWRMIRAQIREQTELEDEFQLLRPLLAFFVVWVPT